MQSYQIHVQNSQLHQEPVHCPKNRKLKYFEMNANNQINILINIFFKSTQTALQEEQLPKELNQKLNKFTLNKIQNNRYMYIWDCY